MKGYDIIGIFYVGVNAEKKGVYYYVILLAEEILLVDVTLKEEK